MSNKTIDINPALFSIGGSNKNKNKTKKNKTLKNLTPIISPNILKNKLLKRIKEHKNKEIKNVVNDDIKNSNIDNNKETLTNDKTNDIIKYSDEFNDSINYLQSLSKQKKINDEKLLYEKNREKKRQELQNKTLKNYNYSNQEPVNSIFVYNELPEELMENLVPKNYNNGTTFNQLPVNIKYNIDNAVPYGNLKGGIKPTMRNWNKTQKNVDNYVSNRVNIMNKINQNSQISSNRENKLNILKDKIKQKQLNEDLTSKSNIDSSKPELPTVSINPPNNNNFESINQDSLQIKQPNDEIPFVLTKNNNKFIKQIHKKTISRKYTLGKSKIKNKVGILLKNRQTRKNILTAQKELKQHSLNDIKKYLRQHNLIKIGSSAPNDVLRKIYESSILTGEITNNNKDTLLHNFMKDENQE
jgi:hypothetical protein